MHSSLYCFWCRVHEGRRSYQIQECPQFYEERVLCIASSRKRPVLKWENNMAWPGKLSLTDRAIYFEVIVLCNISSLNMHFVEKLVFFHMKSVKLLVECIVWFYAYSTQQKVFYITFFIGMFDAHLVGFESTTSPSTFFHRKKKYFR